MFLTEFELIDTDKNKYYAGLEMITSVATDSSAGWLGLGSIRIGIYFDPEKKKPISEAEFQEHFIEKDVRQQIGRAIYKWLHTAATAKNERNFS